MANIMNMLQLKNKPTKSGFDLGRSIKFTAKVGEATPVGPVKVVYPGVTHKINLNSFTRTQAINTAAFARLREYYDFYFVPYEVLWNKFDSVITQMKDNCQHALGPVYDDNEPLSLELPYFTPQAIVEYLKRLNTQAPQNHLNTGSTRAFNTVRLLSYLGYPDFSPYLKDEVTWEKYQLPNVRLSPFPLLAYQKVYADHIRYSQWEKSNPSTFNLDYISGTTSSELDISSNITKLLTEWNMFDLRYCNYNKDMFFGLLPNAQYGDSATVQVSTKGFSYIGTDRSVQNVIPMYATYNGSIETDVNAPTTKTVRQMELKGNFDILALRAAEASQRWKEVTQSVDQDYKSQIEAHFNVPVNDYLAHKSTWLNGYYSNLDINPIVNNNLSAEDSQTTIRAIGTLNTNGEFTFKSQDRYGMIICIYHIAPIVDYQCGIVDNSTLLTDATDFPLPEFDRIGMEPLYFRDLCMYPISQTSADASTLPELPVGVEMAIKSNKVLGYAPRYIKWKTAVDLSLGGFNTNEKSWVLPFDLEALDKAITFNGVHEGGGILGPSIYTFIADTFRINPTIVNKIFAYDCDASYDTDHVRVNCLISDDTTQPLDYNGLPY